MIKRAWGWGFHSCFLLSGRRLVLCLLNMVSFELLILQNGTNGSGLTFSEFGAGFLAYCSLLLFALEVSDGS